MLEHFEAERHYGVLVETIASGESCFRNVFFPDFYLMIAHSEIHLREDFCTGKLIEEIIYSRKRIFVLDCVEVDRTIIND